LEKINIMSDIDKCLKCGVDAVRDRVADEYLYWNCPICESIIELEHLSDINDESWVWVKNYFKKGIKQ
jgi:hypothetical protein